MPVPDTPPAATPSTIRRARAADRSAIDALNRALQSLEAPIRPSRAAADAIPTAYLDELFVRRRERYGDLYVATSGRRIVGFVAWAEGSDPLETDPAEIVVTDLIVAEGRRGEGIGRALVAAVRTAALAKNVRRVQVSTLFANTDAKAAYVALGFRPVSVTLELDTMPDEPGREK